MNSPLRIIITGLVGLYPVGGVAWDYLPSAIALAQLGHDVYYHEDTNCWSYHPIEQQYVSDGSYSAQYINNFFKQYQPELRDKWHYVHLQQTHFGMSQSAFEEVAKTADLFLNVSGTCGIPEQLSSDCIKVFIDTDPGYNQIVFKERFFWSEKVDQWCELLARHDHFFTFAENINHPNCLIPDIGVEWKTTRMPILVNLWHSMTSSKSKTDLNHPWTTVMTWNPFKGRVIYQGVEYKSKNGEFGKVIHLPQKISVPFKIAVGGIKPPVKDLASHGWQVVDAPQATLTPSLYQEFITQSRGEFSVAKNIYVALNSGWFSGRSAHYLAAGKPVVMQDTGFSKILPTGEGLLTFTNLEDAISAIEEVEGNYSRHCQAAYGIAQDYFNSDQVLRKLLEDL